MSESGWTSPGELVAQLQRLWERGDILRSVISGEPLFPKQLRLRRPSTKELSTRFDEVRHWIKSLEEGSRTYGYLLELDEVDLRQLGANQVPGRVIIPTEAEALRIIGKSRAAERFHSLQQHTIAAFPATAGWIARFPMKLLEHESHWSEILSVLDWFSKHPRSGLYRRQLEIEGVDTKFIEVHRRVLTELLEVVLPPETLHSEAGAWFDRRFGLKEKPTLVRFRLLDEAQHISGLSDLSIPTSDLARLQLPVDDVIVTENEVNGLALLPRRRTIVVFGDGYAVEKLGQIGWLRDRRLFYWGDIDTHGFAMLDRFRGHFPHTQSLMMDRMTFLTHKAMWVSEPTPSTESLARLTDEERGLHRELLRATHGERLRLEQERVAFRWVREELAKLEV